MMVAVVVAGGRTRARAVIDKRLDRIPSLSGPRMLYGSLVAAEATSSEAQRHEDRDHGAFTGGKAGIEMLRLVSWKTGLGEM